MLTEQLNSSEGVQKRLKSGRHVSRGMLLPDREVELLVHRSRLIIHVIKYDEYATFLIDRDI